MTSAEWQFEGKGPEAWERFLVPIMESWAEDLVRRAGLRPGDRVLDVGTGTGLVARTAARRLRATANVTGIDVSPAMLDVARQVNRFVHPPIAWIEGDVTDLPFPSASFDKVLSQLVLMFVPDRQAALREIHRVLAPGGRLALSVLRGEAHNPGWAEVARVLTRRVGEDAGEIYRSIFALDDPRALRAWVEAAGFRDVRMEIRVDSARYPSADDLVRWETDILPTPALWERFAQAREAMASDLREALASYADDGGIVFPCEGWVVEATA